MKRVTVFQVRKAVAFARCSSITPLDFSKMKIILQTVCALICVLLVGCFSPRVKQNTIPELIDKTFTPRNTFYEIYIQLYSWENYKTIRDLLTYIRPEEQRQLQDRMNDSRLRWELRMLYAATLASQGNAAGKDYLLNQAQKANPDRLADVFYAVRLTWSLANKEASSAQHPDMTWAEDLMLKALSDRRISHPKYPWPPCTETPFPPVRVLAVRYGNFHEILTELRCARVIPVLCAYLGDEMAESGDDDVFTSEEGIFVTNMLAQWDDDMIESTMSKVAKMSLVKKSPRSEALSDALKWLVQHKKKSGLILALEGLWTSEAYCALVGIKDTTSLAAIRAYLSNLQAADNTKSEDWQLNQQKSATSHAKLILIMGEEHDPVPKLMDFAADSSNEERDLAIRLLEEIKDPRAVAWAENLLKIETDWYIPFRLIALLKETPGNNATNALMNLLRCPFDKIKYENHYTAKDYQERIMDALKERTGQRFVNPKQWLDWHNSQQK